jgi:hypothetical protein
MWPNLMLDPAPSLAFSHRVVEPHEPVLVQALGAELSVEAGHFQKPLAIGGLI